MKWYDVGLELLDNEDADCLRCIKANCSANVTKACQEMLEFWLDRQPKATWSQLITALRAPNIKLNSAAFDIEKMLVSSTEGMVHAWVCVCVYVYVCVCVAQK